MSARPQTGEHTEANVSDEIVRAAGRRGMRASSPHTKGRIRERARPVPEVQSLSDCPRPHPCEFASNAVSTQRHGYVQDL